MSEKSDAEEHLEDVLVVVQLLSNEISMSDNLRPQLDTILSRIPLEIMEKVNQQKCQLAMIILTNSVSEEISKSCVFF